jgi:hypothetical protein
MNTLLRFRDKETLKLVKKTDKKILAKWAIDCASRVLHYNSDKRLRIALETLKTWIKTQKFSMKVIRKASLDSHAAAREVEGPARSAARAAGQAVATAHVKTHSIGSAMYAQQAIYLATNSEPAVAKERAWQYKRLVHLNMEKLYI